MSLQILRTKPRMILARSFALDCAIATLLLVASPPAAQAASAETMVPLQIAAKITADFCDVDIDAAVNEAAKYSAVRYFEPTFRDTIKTGFETVHNFIPTKCEYNELIYSRSWGTKEEDIIYKLMSEKSGPLFVRYIFHVYKGEWALWRFTFKTETMSPLPSDWSHVYP